MLSSWITLTEFQLGIELINGTECLRDCGGLG
jgi:hypothetical protein